MFVRKIALCMILLCLASLFVGLPFVEAHNGVETEQSQLGNAVRQRENALKFQKSWREKHKEAKASVDMLLKVWDDNATAIKDDTWETVNIGVATFIAELIRITNNNDGKSNTEKLIEALPSIWGLVNLAKKASERDSAKANREGYLLALNTAVDAMNEIISENTKAFEAYETKYDAYVREMQNHDGGIVRITNHSQSGNYNSVTATPLETIKTTVKAKSAYNIDDKKNKLEFWYHVADLKSTSQPSVFGFDLFEDFDTFWKLAPLTKKYKCGGGCGQKYETPVEHLVVCPYPLRESTLDIGTGVPLRNLPIDVKVKGKAAPPGSGKMFYLCSVADRNEHCVRKCGKQIKGGGICGHLYRNCTNTKFDHGGRLKSFHGPGGVKAFPLNNLFNAAPGDSHKAVLLSLEAYSKVLWYVAAPGESGLGTLMETDLGDGSLVTADFTHTLGSVAGDYVITAVLVNSNREETESSYTISVRGSTTTLSYSLVSSDGVYTATAGYGHESNFSINRPYSSVHWYVTTPDGVVSNVETEYGDGSKTTSQLGYSFPKGVSGDYEVKTMVYLYPTTSSQYYESSYTVTVSLPSTETTTPTTTTTPTPTFSPVASGLSPSYRAGDTLTLTVDTGAPCYGVHLYIKGKYHWFPGGKSTSSVSVSYTLPSDAATGVWSITLSVYPWNGQTYGSPSYLYKTVRVQ